MNWVLWILVFLVINYFIGAAVMVYLEDRIYGWRKWVFSAPHGLEIWVTALWPASLIYYFFFYKRYQHDT